MKYPKVPKDILPTLIIGLGGTGYQVVKRIKQLFNKRYNTDKLPIRYLLVDTDLKSFLDDSIKNNEKCQLRFGEGIKNTLDWAYNNPNFEWLPQNPKITPDFFTSTDQGAGLVRPIGRMYLCKNAKLVYDNLQTAKNDLVDLHKVLTDLGETYLENIDRHKVYIVGSLAGGTGCGTFLDVAVMVSKIFNRDNTNIIGMFTLESCYDDKLSSDLDAQNRSKANCYAALKELEFYMSSITNADDEKYIFKYSNIGEIKLDRKLLDICYLIENRNEMGGVLTNIDDIYDLCSLQLFQEIGTTLGSQLRADYANFICKDKDPILKKDRHFSTFSSSSMEFPAENLINYCSYRFAKDILGKLESNTDNYKLNLNNEVDGLINNINNRLFIKDVCDDFHKPYTLPARITCNDFQNKEGYLNTIISKAQSKENMWLQNKDNYKAQVTDMLRGFANEAILNHGSIYVSEVLNLLRAALNREAAEIAPTASNRSIVEDEINKMKQDKKKYSKSLKNKEELPSGVFHKFNSFIENSYLKVKKKVYDDRYSIVDDTIKLISEDIKILMGHTTNRFKDIEILIKKIENQSEKKYGGNIISREIITKEFYESYYNKQVEKNFNSIIAAIFKDNNLLQIIKSGTQELIECCRKQFEESIYKESITDVLYKNYQAEKLRRGDEEKKFEFKDYIKNELDVAAKLAKPFWSAIKNPEVSWTECFYIGCMKGETNNGFTIKAPEEIDEWIRNQTGERSRWARYVETTNPYSIDVIHITMGACAAYLPDINHYKQFYLKLLSSKTYPLHLNEAYVGLEELDTDFDEILLTYSLAKAYGAIIDKNNTAYLNIKQEEGEYRYIYSSKYCLGSLLEESKEEQAEGNKNEAYAFDNDNIPENKVLIPEELKLGDNYHETIRRISENTKLHTLLKDFIEDAASKFGKEELEKHCMQKYVQDKLPAETGSKASEDFIAKNKLINKVNFH